MFRVFAIPADSCQNLKYFLRKSTTSEPFSRHWGARPPESQRNATFSTLKVTILRESARARETGLKSLTVSNGILKVRVFLISPGSVRTLSISKETLNMSTFGNYATKAGICHDKNIWYFQRNTKGSGNSARWRRFRGGALVQWKSINSEPFSRHRGSRLPGIPRNATFSALKRNLLEGRRTRAGSRPQNHSYFQWNTKGPCLFGFFGKR